MRIKPLKIENNLREVRIGNEEGYGVSKEHMKQQGSVGRKLTMGIRGME